MRKRKKRGGEKNREKDRFYAYVSAARWPVQGAWALLASLSKCSNYNVLQERTCESKKSSRLSSSQTAFKSFYHL